MRRSLLVWSLVSVLAACSEEPTVRSAGSGDSDTALFVDTGADTAADTGAGEDTAPDTTPDTAPDTGADTAPDTASDTGVDTGEADGGPLCGNGQVDPGEQCDDGNSDDTDNCTAGCRLTFCGDGIANRSEPCDGLDLRGETCVSFDFDGGVLRCAVGCEVDTSDCSNAVACGDGVVDAGEACDDANTNNNDGCTNACQPPRCGDGFVQTGEGCDDGNTLNTDTCTNDCTAARCGDGFAQPGEGCDDGNSRNDDDCTNGCTIATCGDGLVQTGEGCDDGNRVNTDGCSNLCTPASCGDAIVQTDEACDDGNGVNTDACTNNCTVAACGDGYTQLTEACDDGNGTTEPCAYGLRSCTVCSSACRLVAGNTDFCGDTITDPGEGCDDGNTVTEGCSYGLLSCVVCDASCARVPGNTDYCGDGVRDAGEQCDDGALNSDSARDACRTDCTLPVCGDLVLDGIEQCDDGNNVTEECAYGVASCTICDATCAEIRGETDFCGDAVRDPSESCDDGNTVTEECAYGLASCTVCNSVCTSVAGDTDRCGDGVIDAVESCDDGNTLTEECAYGVASCTVCSSACASVAGDTDLCGDGIRDTGEACDDGNAVTEECAYGAASCTVCNSACASVAGDTDRCGDGVVDATEGCDDGNTTTEECAYGAVSCTVCNSTCQTVQGDTDLCGDGVRDVGEGCDDGNTTTEECGYGVDYCAVCDSTCRSVPGDTDLCGDGVTDAGEQCDDGLLNSDLQGDACRTDCTLPFCGDGVRDGSESCDDGNNVTEECAYGQSSCTICDATCGQLAGETDYCGDGVVDAAEACDNGTTQANNVCTSSCLLQLGATCTPDGLNPLCRSGWCGGGRCAPNGMSQIASGTYNVGSPDTEFLRDADETQHAVTFTRGFFMGQTEVTQGAWKALAGGTNPSSFPACGDNCPVDFVDWYAALALANARSLSEGLNACYEFKDCTLNTGWRDGAYEGCVSMTFTGLGCNGYRLPTESEWEVAARAGSTTGFYNGAATATGSSADPLLGLIGWYNSNSASTPRPVRGKTPNAWSISDTAGNMAEWVWDGYAPFTAEALTDPLGAVNTAKVLRGGAWNKLSRECRTPDRVNFEQTTRNSTTGLRLARTTLLCSNGVVNAGEECDYGLLNSNTAPDGCRNDCRRAFCGDGAVDTGEVCDDRNRVNNDACKNDCTVGLGTPCYPDGANAACVSGYCGNGRCAPTGMSYIEAGTFLMGSPTTELGRSNESIPTSTTIARNYFMDRSEVTQGAWKALSGGINPSYFQAVSGTTSCSATPDVCPVEQANWWSAVQFANAKSLSEGLEECYALTGCTANAWKAGSSSCSSVVFYHGEDCTGYRLPSEPEWEYAYRAGTTTAFYNGPITQPDGNDPNLNLIGWYNWNSGSKTHPVGQKDPNAWGLFDIAGNVFEMVNLNRSGSTSLMVRGGYFSGSASLSRAANREYDGWYSRSSRQAAIGLRLARTVPPQNYTPPTF